MLKKFKSTLSTLSTSPKPWTCTVYPFLLLLFPIIILYYVSRHSVLVLILLMNPDIRKMGTHLFLNNFPP